MTVLPPVLGQLATGKNPAEGALLGSFCRSKRMYSLFCPIQALTDSLCFNLSTQDCELGVCVVDIEKDFTFSLQAPIVILLQSQISKVVAYLSGSYPIKNIAIYWEAISSSKATSICCLPDSLGSDVLQ